MDVKQVIFLYCCKRSMRKKKKNTPKTLKKKKPCMVKVKIAYGNYYKMKLLKNRKTPTDNDTKQNRRPGTHTGHEDYQLMILLAGKQLPSFSGSNTP